MPPCFCRVAPGFLCCLARCCWCCSPGHGGPLLAATGCSHGWHVHFEHWFQPRAVAVLSCQLHHPPDWGSPLHCCLRPTHPMLPPYLAVAELSKQRGEAADPQEVTMSASWQFDLDAPFTL